MASIIKTSIDLTKIDKSKIITGAKGKYLPISLTLNDEVDQFGNQGPVIIEQTKEERAEKVAKIYLGNCKVVWTNGTFPDRITYDGAAAPPPKVEKQEEDLPF